jgi:hypothetical protein
LFFVHRVSDFFFTFVLLPEIVDEIRRWSVFVARGVSVSISHSRFPVSRFKIFVVPLQMLPTRARCPYCHGHSLAFGVPCDRCRSRGSGGAAAPAAPRKRFADLHPPASRALQWVFGLMDASPQRVEVVLTCEGSTDVGTRIVPTSWLQRPMSSRTASRQVPSLAPTQTQVVPTLTSVVQAPTPVVPASAPATPAHTPVVPAHTPVVPAPPPVMPAPVPAIVLPQPAVQVPCTQGQACVLHSSTLGCLTRPVKLGEGGQGAAFRVVIINGLDGTRCKAAAKEVKTNSRALPILLDRMRAFQDLSHPNLARVLAVWPVSRSEYALVMDLYPGTLYNIMVWAHQTQVRPCYPFVRHVLRGLLEALAYLQSQDFVHRDIKPQNVAFELHKDVEVLYPELVQGLNATGDQRAHKIMWLLSESWLASCAALSTHGTAAAAAPSPPPPPFEIKLIDYDFGRPIGAVTPSGNLPQALSCVGTPAFQQQGARLAAGAPVAELHRGEVYSVAATIICCAEVVHPTNTDMPDELRGVAQFTASCKESWLRRGYPVAFFELVADMMSGNPAICPDPSTALRRLIEIS